MAANLTGQVRNIAEVTTAVGQWRFSKKITVDVKARFWNSKHINTHGGPVELLRFGSKARGERGRNEGKLAARPRVIGVRRYLKDLTEQCELHGRHPYRPGA